MQQRQRMSTDSALQHDLWSLTYSDSTDVADTDGWSEGDQDAFEVFWQVAMNGLHFDGTYPKGFKIWVELGDRTIADFPAVGLPLILFSDRLLARIKSLISGSVQAFPAPLYQRKTLKKVEGFNFVNVRTVVDCIDGERSHPRYVCGNIVGYSEPVILREKIVGDIFKYSVEGRASSEVIVSKKFVDALSGCGFTGIRFRPVNSV